MERAFQKVRKERPGAVGSATILRPQAVNCGDKVPEHLRKHHASTPPHPHSIPLPSILLHILFHSASRFIPFLTHTVLHSASHSTPFCLTLHRTHSRPFPAQERSLETHRRSVQQPSPRPVACYAATRRYCLSGQCRAAPSFSVAQIQAYIPKVRGPRSKALHFEKHVTTLQPRVPRFDRHRIPGCECIDLERGFPPGWSNSTWTGLISRFKEASVSRLKRSNGPSITLFTSFQSLPISACLGTLLSNYSMTPEHRTGLAFAG